jgi:hypothetical protein
VEIDNGQGCSRLLLARPDHAVVAVGADVVKARFHRLEVNAYALAKAARLEGGRHFERLFRGKDKPRRDKDGKGKKRAPDPAHHASAARAVTSSTAAPMSARQSESENR